MTSSILASHPRTWLPGIGENHLLLVQKGMSNDYSSRIHYCFGCSILDSSHVRGLVKRSQMKGGSSSWAVLCGKKEGSESGMESEDDEPAESSQESEVGPVNSDSLREKLEKIVGADDSRFSGMDLATLIRNKYGRSYDVQLIKKEFMGRNLLALNVMWKYVEQRSFPLTEEEYILRLDDVANTLKCWGAVSHVRNSLEKSKERPRIGKAVSIFIDMDDKGGRANEWIYR